MDSDPLRVSFTIERVILTKKIEAILKLILIKSFNYEHLKGNLRKVKYLNYFKIIMLRRIRIHAKMLWTRNTA